MATYLKTSPWADTPANNLYLELLSIRPVPAEADDFRYVIENQYKHRPDLLSYDLYGTSKLWWVFAARNPNRLGPDPYFDFKAGVGIYVPTQTALNTALGL